MKRPRSSSSVAHRMARVAVAILVLGGVLALAEPAQACTCDPVEETDAYGEASTAVIAELVEVVDEGPQEVGTYEVLATLKGSAPETFELSVSSEFDGGIALNSCDSGSLPEGPMGFISRPQGADDFTLSLCLPGPWEPEALIDLAEQALPAPEGASEVTFLWAERFGAARYLALDTSGLISGYGFGPGVAAAIEPCSDGRSFAELVRTGDDSVLTVGDLATLGGDGGASVQIDEERAPGFADQIGCTGAEAWALDRCDPSACVASVLTVLRDGDVVSETELPRAVAAFAYDHGERAIVVIGGENPRIKDRALGRDDDGVEIASLPDDRRPFMADRAEDGRIAVAVLDPASVDPTSERASDVIVFDAEGNAEYSFPMNQPALTELRWLDDGRLVVVGTGFFSTYQEVWIVGTDGRTETYEQVGQPLVGSDGTILAMSFDEETAAVGGLDDERTVVLEQRPEQLSVEVAAVTGAPVPMADAAHERVLEDPTGDLTAEWAAVQEELAAGDEQTQGSTTDASDADDLPWVLLVVLVAGIVVVAIVRRRRARDWRG